MLDQNQIKSIVHQLDLVELVREYVPTLKRSGQTWIACCPFHRETSPSFYVYPNTQTWNCFSCNAQGDTLDFLQRSAGMDFTEALEEVCKRVGVESPFTQRGNAANKEQSQLYEINQHVAMLTREELYKTSGEKARDYLLGRGIAAKVWEQWGIGFYPPSGFRELLKVYPAETLEAASILVKGREPFAGRITFPLLNQQGRNIGFSARGLTNVRPKYLNSTNSKVFEKSRFLFGLHAAARNMRLSKRAVFVEGQLDVIAAHAAGTREVVGIMGTAINEGIVQTALGIAPQLIIALDADKAGTAATFAWAKRLESLSNIYVAVIPEAKDAHELLTTVPNGDFHWEKCLNLAVPVVDHLIMTLGPEAKTINEKKALAGELWALCGKTIGIEREAHLDSIAKALNVSASALASTLRVTVAAPAAPKAIVSLPIPVEPLSPAEQLLALGLCDSRWFDRILEFLTSDDFGQTVEREVFDQIKDMYLYGVEDVTPSSIVGKTAQEYAYDLIERYREVISVLPANREPMQEREQLIEAIRHNRWKVTCEEKRTQLNAAIARADWDAAGQYANDLQALAYQEKNEA